MAIENDFDPPCSDALQALAGGLQPFRALSPSNKLPPGYCGADRGSGHAPEEQGPCQQSLCAVYHPNEHISGADEQLLRMYQTKGCLVGRWDVPQGL